jgi:hypothetical protein
MATDIEWQLPEVVLTQFVSPDDEHNVLETRRELKISINTYKRIVSHVVHLPRINTNSVCNIRDLAKHQTDVDPSFSSTSENSPFLIMYPLE